MDYCLQPSIHVDHLLLGDPELLQAHHVAADPLAKEDGRGRKQGHPMDENVSNDGGGGVWGLAHAHLAYVLPWRHG